MMLFALRDLFQLAMIDLNSKKSTNPGDCTFWIGTHLPKKKENWICNTKKSHLLLVHQRIIPSYVASKDHTCLKFTSWLPLVFLISDRLLSQATFRARWRGEHRCSLPLLGYTRTGPRVTAVLGDRSLTDTSVLSQTLDLLFARNHSLKSVNSQTLASFSSGGHTTNMNKTQGILWRGPHQLPSFFFSYIDSSTCYASHGTSAPCSSSGTKLVM